MPACPWGWIQLTTISSRGVRAQSNAPAARLCRGSLHTPAAPPSRIIPPSASMGMLGDQPEPGWSPPMKLAGIACLGVSFQCGSDALVMLACTRAGPQFAATGATHTHIPTSSVTQGRLSRPHTGIEQSPRGTVLSDKPLSDLGLPLKGFFNAPPLPFSLFSTAGTTGHSREIFTHH